MVSHLYCYILRKSRNILLIILMRILFNVAWTDTKNPEIRIEQL